VTTEFLCESTKHDASDNVVYSEAVGQGDALHYILSTVGVPTVMVFHTPLGSHPMINCTNLLSHNVSSVENSIRFSQPPFYTYAVMFTKVRPVTETLSVQDSQYKQTFQVIPDLVSFVLRRL